MKKIWLEKIQEPTSWAVAMEISLKYPLIKRYRKLPSERLEYSCSTNGPLFAFGLDLRNDDYKVLRVVDLNVKVYSLKSNSWKGVEEEWPIDKASICSKPTYFNGALHFKVKTPDYTTNLPRGMRLIVSFDLATKKFHVFKTPSQGTWREHLEVLGGHLCFISMDPYGQMNFVWMMKEYGVDGSWTRIYKIEKDTVPLTCDFCKPVMFSKDKKLVLEEGLENLLVEALGRYDMEKKIDKKKRDMFQFQVHNVLYTVTCIGSLLLLDGDNVIEEKRTNYFEDYDGDNVIEEKRSNYFADYQKVEGSKHKREHDTEESKETRRKKVKTKQLSINSVNDSSFNLQ